MFAVKASLINLSFLNLTDVCWEVRGKFFSSIKRDRAYISVKSANIFFNNVETIKKVIEICENMKNNNIRIKCFFISKMCNVFGTKSSIKIHSPDGNFQVYFEDDSHILNYLKEIADILEKYGANTFDVSRCDPCFIITFVKTSKSVLGKIPVGQITIKDALFFDQQGKNES